MRTALAQLADELATLRAEQLQRELRGPLPAAAVNFCSNDYLGLATSDALADAARAVLPRGTGAGAARLVGGDSDLHQRLEQRVARFKGAEAALLFSSGYQANVGALAALLGPEDAVYSDALNHASIVDGCRLSRARIHRYAHADVDDLARKLEGGARHRRRLVVTDAIFGMDGDAAPLAAIAALAKRHDALLFVDEAHATGVRGPRGRGLLAELSLQADLSLVTFGKALGVFGAALVGSRTIVDYLVTRCRTFIFTTALPPSLCAAAIAAIDLVDAPRGDRLRARLDENAAHLALGLRALGLPPAAPGPIQPIVIGEPEPTLTASRELLARGFFAQAIRPPTVPPGTSRLRLAVSAAHSTEQIDALLRALAQTLSAARSPTASPPPQESP